MGSLIDHESQKIFEKNKTVLSTTVAELYSFMKCYLDHVMFLHGLLMDISGDVANIHMKTDAKNLLTTARTIHLPEHRGDHPHDFYVAKRSLFRKYS